MHAKSASYTLGLVDLPANDREQIGQIVEHVAARTVFPWLVLYTDSCNLLIVDGQTDFEAANDQIVVRIYDSNQNAAEGLALHRPLDARALITLLHEAEGELSKRSRSNCGSLGLSVKTIAPDRPAHSAASEAPAPSAGLAGVTAQRGQAGPSAIQSDDHGAYALAESWADVAIAMYSIMQSGAPTVATIDVPDRGTVSIDFRYRIFSCEGSLSNFPLVPHTIRLRTEIVGKDAPAAVELPGQQLDKFLWFVGHNAFGNAQAPWLCPDDRFRLQRWPNFTELSHSMEHMRLTAAMGNRFLGIEELCTIGDAPREVVVRMLNAYSLMGLVLNSPAAPPLEAPAPTAASEDRPKGLFGKLISKLGL